MIITSDNLSVELLRSSLIDKNLNILEKPNGSDNHLTLDIHNRDFHVTPLLGERIMLLSASKVNFPPSLSREELLEIANEFNSDLMCTCRAYLIDDDYIGFTQSLHVTVQGIAPEHIKIVLLSFSIECSINDQVIEKKLLSIDAT
jgi:hypothetical protein